MAPTSFGLRPENKSYILEEVFILMEYCNFTWTEAWELPIVYRKWMIDRKQKELDKKAEAEKKGNNPPPPPGKPPAKPTKPASRPSR